MPSQKALRILGGMSVDDPARPIDDTERAATISRLRAAAEDGRLAPHELDARVARAREARLAGQLAAVMTGVPPEPPPGAPAVWPTAKDSMPQGHPSAQVGAPPAAHVTPSIPQAPGYRPEDRLALTAGMSDEKRSGQWTVPPYVRVQAGLSKVKLDCRHATTTGPLIDVEVGAGVDNVVLVVPPGWGVDTDRLGKGIGSIKVKVPRAASAGCPTLLFHGQLGMSTLVVREANWLERRRDKRA